MNRFREGPPIVLVAMGGHAFILKGEMGTIEDHEKNAKYIAGQMACLLKDDYRLVPESLLPNHSGQDAYTPAVAYGNGTFLGEWGEFGSTVGLFNGPCRVVVGPTGSVYVTDRENHRIQKFNSSGTFLAKWGSQGSAKGKFNLPYGLAVDNSSNVYVADTDNHRIQKFDGSGTFLIKWGTHGSGDGQFDSPHGMAVASDRLRGMRTTNLVPRFSSESSSMVPPWTLAMLWETNNPRPVPSTPLDEKKALKARSRVSRSMPMPLSSISKRTRSGSPKTPKRTEC